MRYRTLVFIFATVLSGLIAVWAHAASPAEGVSAEVAPSVIPMGTFYSGTKVHVQGRVPVTSDVIVFVRGPEITEVYNKVGRAGAIWVNTGKVRISGVPSLLLVFSTKPVFNCLCRGEIDHHMLDAAAIKNQVKVIPAATGGDLVAGEFLKLKFRQGSYQLDNRGIRKDASLEDGERFVLDFEWPKNIAPGTYVLRVCACRDGFVRDSLDFPLKVQEVGFPAMIADLARERPSTYGIISVVVAILAGFGIDFITTRIFK